MLLNFTNPAGILTELVLKHTNVKTIGLCNIPIGTRMQMAKLCDTDVDNVFIEMIGINHLNWTTKIVVEGKDITDEVLSKASGSTGLTMKNIPDFGWDRSFLAALGALPCGYHRYFYMEDQMLQEQLDSLKTTGTRAEVVKRVEEELFELYKDPNLAIKPPQLQERGGAYYSDAALELVSSIYNNKGDIQTVNVRNNGIIPCLPNDVSVEVNCVIDSQGAHPIQLTTEISPQIRGLMQVVKAYEELTIEAGIKGDYDLAIQALTINPLVGSIDVAKLILDDILAENEAYLPQFKKAEIEA